MCESTKVEEESRKIVQAMIDHSLSEICSAAWAARSAKHEAIKRNEGLLQENRALLQDVNELQKKRRNDCVMNYLRLVCIPI